MRTAGSSHALSDPTTKKYFTCREVAAMLMPGGTTRSSHRRVYAWVKVGIKVGGKNRVRLECTWLPGMLAFTQAQVDRFVEEITVAQRRRAGLPPAGPSGMEAPRYTPGRVIPHGFERCAREEIGTYPPEEKQKVSGANRRGAAAMGSLRLARGRATAAGQSAVRSRRRFATGERAGTEGTRSTEGGGH